MHITLDPSEPLHAIKAAALQRRGLPLSLDVPLRIEGYPEGLLPHLAFCIATPRKAEEVSSKWVAVAACPWGGCSVGCNGKAQEAVHSRGFH